MNFVFKGKYLLEFFSFTSGEALTMSAVSISLGLIRLRSSPTPPSPVSQGSTPSPTTPRSTGSGSIDSSLLFQDHSRQTQTLRPFRSPPIHFPNAEQNLNLSFQRITDSDLHQSVGRLEDAMSDNLQNLLRQCDGVADDALQSLVRRYRDSSPGARIDFRGLREEFLARCETHPSLQEQASRCRGKLRIQLRDCGNITSVGLLSLIQVCPDLQSLDVSSCSWMDDRTLAAVAAYCPHLKILKVSFCEGITDEGVGTVQAQRPGCVILRRA